ncbi:hypothetical protein CVV43_00870 [Candidatus Saccharibacteria bacterium HGW-Saccharibacteria-1]|jgi:broad specificity phosphatase PhoE|nr:MAG: hypothetical protein CVV43_00870 [Candidatus Saccharibacteria bacterium HGW-Saccharibacteria-1]
MAIYFLRHGESVANVQNIFAGQKNNALLTPLGVEQARQVGAEIKKLNINRIIASNLTRAIETATEVANVIGFDSNRIEIDERIAEYDTGTLTNEPIRKISSLDFIKVDGAEDVKHFHDRVVSFLKQYKNSTDNILMVSHAGVDRMIKASSRGIDLKTFYDIPGCPNTYLIKLDLAWLD